MKKEKIPLIHFSNEDKWFDKLEEAIEYFSKNEYINLSISLDECHLDENGIFTIGDQKVQLTDFSYRILLEKLNIPYNFVYNICPIDLEVQIINRLLKEGKGKKVLFWCNMTKNTLESITNIDFSPIRHITFLSAFEEAFGINNILEIHLSTGILSLVRLLDLKKDPNPGDYFQFGIEFINYDIFFEKNTLMLKPSYLDASVLTGPN